MVRQHQQVGHQPQPAGDGGAEREGRGLVERLVAAGVEPLVRGGGVLAERDGVVAALLGRLGDPGHPGRGDQRRVVADGDDRVVDGELHGCSLQQGQAGQRVALAAALADHEGRRGEVGDVAGQRVAAAGQRGPRVGGAAADRDRLEHVVGDRPAHGVGVPRGEGLADGGGLGGPAVMLDVGVVGLHGQVEGDHPAGVHDRPLGVLVVDGGDHPAVLSGDALVLALVLALGGALGQRGPDHVVPPGPGEQAVADDPVGRPAGRRRHQPVERAEQDRRVDAAEHRRADHGVDPVELPVVADALPVLRLQPGADGADQVGHARDRPVGGDAEPVPVDLVRAGAEAEEDAPGRVVPGAAMPAACA